MESKDIRCPYCRKEYFYRIIQYPVRQLISPNKKAERREKSDGYMFPEGKTTWHCDNCENPMPDVIGKKITRKWDTYEWPR